MTSDEFENDPLFGAMATLRTRDVHQRRADALRNRCHALLETRARRDASVDRLRRASFRRAIGTALAAAWCAAYLLEIIHRAAAVYGF